MKFNYGKTFLLGFGFFGVSVIWAIYNAFVPLFLANKFDLAPALIGFFMTLDNIAAFFIQPPVGAWSDRLRTPIGRRMPFILIGAPVGALAFGLIPLAAVLPLFVACTSTLLLSMAFWRTPVVALMPDITPSQLPLAGQRHHQLHGRDGRDHRLPGRRPACMRSTTAYPFWLGSVLVIVASLLVFVFIREPRMPHNGSSDRRQDPTCGAACNVEAVSRWPRQDKSALRILLAIFFWFVGLQRHRSLLHPLRPESPGAAGRRWRPLAGPAFASSLCSLPFRRLHRRRAWAGARPS